LRSGRLGNTLGTRTMQHKILFLWPRPERTSIQPLGNQELDG
jgi:hypothetical protein